MANHKSSLKRIRQEETRRLHNRYYGKTMRNAVRKLRATTDKAEATAMYPGITKMLDKLAKTNVIHKNKANNLKSKLAVYINKLGLADKLHKRYERPDFLVRPFLHSHHPRTIVPKQILTVLKSCKQPKFIKALA